MMPVNPDVYKIAYQYSYVMCNGKINLKFLEMVCETMWEKNIESEEAAKEHCREWRRKNLGRYVKR